MGWAGGGLGPSCTPRQLRLVQSAGWPLQPSLAKAAQGISLGQTVCFTGSASLATHPVLPCPRPQILLSLGSPPSGVGGASCPFAILEKFEGNWEGQARAEGGGGFCPFVRLHGAGNKVIMLLMGRDKRVDQCVSTIVGQEGPERGAGLPCWEDGSLGAHGCMSHFQVP